MTPQLPQQPGAAAPDPTTQGQKPWWQIAAESAAAAGNGATQPAQQGQRPNPANPWPQFGAAMGKLAGGIKTKLAQRNDPESGARPGNALPTMENGDTGGETDTPVDMSAVADMGIPAADGVVVTKPTRVLLAEHGQPEAVVPLGYRAGAKVRPSVAMAPKPGRNYYGG